MSQLPRIVALTDQSSGWGFFLCTRKEERLNREGHPFLSLMLQDVSGQMAAKVFDRVAECRDEFDEGEFVKVQGRGNRFQQRFELVLDRVRRVDSVQDALDGFREEDCIPSAPRPIDEMWQELRQLVAEVRDPWIRPLLSTIVERSADRLRTWPAAVTVHHAYRGGLLEHVLQVARTGRALASAYGVDPDLVVAGAVLHDIGKLEELDYDGATAYTRTGNLLGHITLGVMMVHATAQEIEGFPEDVRTRIEHMIVSHHGSREQGSPIEPLSEESLLLSVVDDLDARLHQFRRHVHEDRGEGDFTAYHPRLKRVLLKPSGR